MLTNTVKRVAMIALLSISFGFTSLTSMAAPSHCPSVSAIKAQATLKGLKNYGDRYLFRQYSSYNTGSQWEFVVTNNEKSNPETALNALKNGYTGLSGAPSPSQKAGKGTWICEYKMADHTVVANYPAICSKDLCGA